MPGNGRRESRLKRLFLQKCKSALAGTANGICAAAKSVMKFIFGIPKSGHENAVRIICGLFYFRFGLLRIFNARCLSYQRRDKESFAEPQKDKKPAQPLNRSSDDAAFACRGKGPICPVVIPGRSRYGGNAVFDGI